MVWYHCNTFHITPHHIPHAHSISQNTWHSTPHLTGCAVCGGTVWQSMVCTVLHEEMWCNVECCAVRCGIMLLWCGKAWCGNTVTHPISHSISHHTTPHHAPFHITKPHLIAHHIVHMILQIMWLQCRSMWLLCAMWWSDVTKHGVKCVTSTW